MKTSRILFNTLGLSLALALFSVPVAAEEAPEGEVGAARLHVPKRHVEGGDGEHGRPAAAAVVERPPELVPDVLDPVRVFIRDQAGDLAAQYVCYCTAVSPACERVADAFGPVSTMDPGSDDLETIHCAMHRVRQHLIKPDQVMTGLNGLDGGWPGGHG